MPVELIVPSAGESITEVQIGNWKVAEGAHIDRDGIIVDIETDKITVELPAPVSGTLTKILIPEGEEAKVGDVIGLIEEGAAPAGGSAPAASAANGQAAPAAPAAPVSSAPSGDAGDSRVMPAAQRLIDENKLDAGAINGTGPGGRILKSDVQRFLDRGGKSSSGGAKPAPAPATASVGIDAGVSHGSRHEEIKPMTPLRRTIARRLVEAQQTAALLTTFNEVDMSAVMALRSQYKEGFEKRHGVKLGFMSFFVKAAVDALQQYPALNAEIRDEKIVYKDYCDIGVAIGGGRGLVVPVLRNAESMSFADIEKQIGVLAVKARDNKLTMDELTGGTFTITNGGVFGSLLSTPIINPPQSGVLGMHTIQQRPVVIDGEITVRPMMYLAMTYDHRIVDGREAVTFLVRLKQTIEDPTRLLMEV